jgi:hypothetical protein
VIVDAHRRLEPEHRRSRSRARPRSSPSARSGGPRRSPRLAAGDRTVGTRLSLGNALFHAGERRRVIEAYPKVPAGSHDYKTAIYNVACAYALDGKKAEALVALKKAFAAGVRRCRIPTSRRSTPTSRH